MDQHGAKGSAGLNSDQVRRFEEDGFVVLNEVVPPDTIESLRRAFDDAVSRLAEVWMREGLLDDSMEELPFETRYAAIRRKVPARFATTWRRAVVSRAVYDLWQTPALLAAARSLIGPEIYAHGTWNGRPREPNSAVQRVDWHQDAHYYRAWSPEDGRLVSVWVPLVPVDVENGCLQVMARSHRGGYVEPTRGPDNMFTIADEELDRYEPVDVVLDPGDALLFSDLTIHRAHMNRSEAVRWSIDVRFATASEAIISKSERGYYCASADPGRIEPYSVWADRYSEPEPIWYASTDLKGDLDADAASLGVSRSELEVF